MVLVHTVVLPVYLVVLSTQVCASMVNIVTDTPNGVGNAAKYGYCKAHARHDASWLKYWVYTHILLIIDAAPIRGIDTRVYAIRTHRADGSY